ncbi:MAG: hypothetical protein KC420_20930 [Myxococcales bacterium]|nr:hypothetical protein [Myxococcales bacterium]MCB9703826.1 hypothetical protein [Myxococcales bacterium]
MGTNKIDALAELLEKTGGDAERLEVVRRTQRFKRSWIELAEALAKVRASSSFTRWGYSDFYTYCQQELTLKKSTVDKLVLSFHTIRSHAPEVLEWDGVAKVIPSYEAVDYFSRAVGEFESEPPIVDGKGKAPREAKAEEAPEVIREVRQAVFDEGQPLAELRKRFDPVLYPRPKGAERLEIIQKASAAARKLAELLPDIDGLEDKRVQRIETELGALRQELDALATSLKSSLDKPGKKKPPRLKVAAPV